jgi:hypothetical protein
MIYQGNLLQNELGNKDAVHPVQLERKRARAASREREVGEGEGRGKRSRVTLVVSPITSYSLPCLSPMIRYGLFTRTNSGD